MLRKVEELASLPDQVVGIASGHQPMYTGLGSCPGCRTGGKERRPFREFRRDCRQQRPSTGRLSTMARSSPCRQHSGGRTQRREMRLGVTIYWKRGVLSIKQALPSLLKEAAYAGQPVTASFVLRPLVVRVVVSGHDSCREGSSGGHFGLLVGSRGGRPGLIARVDSAVGKPAEPGGGALPPPHRRAYSNICSTPLG